MDEDSLVSCLAIIIGIGLAIYLVVFLVGIVVELLSITFPAWDSGILAGLITYGIARIKLHYDLHSPAKFSHILNFEFDGFSLQGKIDLDGVKEYILPYKIIPVFISILITTVVLISMVTDKAGWIQIFGSIITGVIIVGFLSILYIQLDLTSVFNQNVNSALDKANRTFQSSDELESIIRENSLLAHKLQIEFPQNGVEAIRNFINLNKEKVITNSSSLEVIIENEIEKAKLDRFNLQEAETKINEFMHFHQSVSQIIFATGSPSMVNAIDSIHEQFYQAKEVCLSQREWTTFQEAIIIYMQELNQLKDQAINLTNNTSISSNENNPYKILGVTPDMTNKQINNIYYSLCKIYHSDKGKVHNEDKMKEINSAYQKIMEKRKLQ